MDWRKSIELAGRALWLLVLPLAIILTGLAGDRRLIHSIVEALVRVLEGVRLETLLAMGIGVLAVRVYRSMTAAPNATPPATGGQLNAQQSSGQLNAQQAGGQQTSSPAGQQTQATSPAQEEGRFTFSRHWGGLGSGEGGWEIDRSALRFLVQAVTALSLATLSAVLLLSRTDTGKPQVSATANDAGANADTRSDAGEDPKALASASGAASKTSAYAPTDAGAAPASTADASATTGGSTAPAVSQTSPSSSAANVSQDGGR